MVLGIGIKTAHPVVCEVVTSNFGSESCKEWHIVELWSRTSWYVKPLGFVLQMDWRNVLLRQCSQLLHEIARKPQVETTELLV